MNHFIDNFLTPHEKLAPFFRSLNFVQNPALKTCSTAGSNLWQILPVDNTNTYGIIHPKTSTVAIRHVLSGMYITIIQSINNTARTARRRMSLMQPASATTARNNNER